MEYEEKIVTRNWGRIDRENLKYDLANGSLSSLNKALKLLQEDIISEIESSGLRERNEAGLQVGGRWAAFQNTKSDIKCIIGDFTEGNQECGIVGAIMENDCVTPLEGLLISAYATGATRAYVVINHRNRKSIENMKNDLRKMEELKLSGTGIWGSGFHISIELMVIDDEPVFGEEDALIRALEGKAPVHLKDNSDILTSGYGGNPTLIHKAETLASIPAIIEKGWEWFRKIGTEQSPGTKLWQISRDGTSQEMILEAPMGTKLSDVISQIEVSGEWKAALLGGYLGSYFPPDKFDIKLDFESLKENGAMMGSGLVKLLDTENCIIETTYRCFERSRHESCGKCMLCRMGTKQVCKIMEDIIKGKGKAADIELLNELGANMKLGASCNLGKSIINPLVSGMTYFSDEYEAHVRRKRCAALVCQGYITYHILGDQCQGCGDCLNACPEDAIEGESGYVHVIDQDYCTKCGRCLQICPHQGAVVKAGGVKPRTPDKPVRVGSWKSR